MPQDREFPRRFGAALRFANELHHAGVPTMGEIRGTSESDSALSRTSGGSVWPLRRGWVARMAEAARQVPEAIVAERGHAAPAGL